MESVFCHKEKLSAYIDNILDKKQAELAKVNELGLDVVERIKKFMTGKMVRGSLILASCEAAGGKVDENALNTAAAIEFIHAGLLIHDDIMDKDTLRRGNPSVHAQYSEVCKDAHVGMSLGLCAGDLCLFIASGLVPEKVKKIFAQEFERVTVAQMQDMWFLEPSRDAIARLQRFKTARYTFALPLIAGAMLAGKEEKSLDECGEVLGMMFQLKDDEMSLFGDESVTGKSAKSDVREDKKTLHRHLLSECAAEELKNATSSDEVLSLMKKYDIQKKVDEEMDKLEIRVRAQMSGLSEPYQKLMEELIMFNKTRTK